MKQKDCWAIAIIAVLGIVVISGCTQQAGTQAGNQVSTRVSSCEELAKNFDDKIDSINGAVCNKWLAEGQKPIWVGGELINVSKIYNPWYERNEFTLTFRGSEKEGSIHIETKNEDIPYETGKFYKFDLGNKCKLIFSMASSGAFSDPNLDALEHLEECD